MTKSSISAKYIEHFFFLSKPIAILLLKGLFKSEKIIFKCFFHIASDQIFKNGAIMINHRSFIQGKDSLQLDCYKFLKINSSMTETIKKQFSETKFL